MTFQTIPEQTPDCKDQRLCQNCGVILTHRDQIKYCSKDCVKEFRKKESDKRRERTCVQCGSVFFVNKKNGNHARRSVKEGQFCSRACVGKFRSDHKKVIGLSCRVFFNTCSVCGQVFTARREDNKKCSHTCRSTHAKELNFIRNSSNQIIPERKCKECGKAFIPVYGSKRRSFCSARCQRKYGVRHFRIKSDKARAEKYGVKYEYINPMKVLVRDGWTCQLCGKKTPQKRRGTNYPNAPEVDHIVPISRGGHHLYSNLQCACRACNGKKSNNNSKGQLHLFC